MYLHTYERWVTSVAEIIYDEKTVFSKNTQKFICESLGFNNNMINWMRTAGYRAMVKDPSKQTGYVSTGSPESDKSKWHALLVIICQNLSKACELNDLENKFNTTELEKLNLLIVNELLSVNEFQERMLKSFQG
jgi:hypothetical protein